MRVRGHHVDDRAAFRVLHLRVHERREAALMHDGAARPQLASFPRAQEPAGHAAQPPRRRQRRARGRRGEAEQRRLMTELKKELSRLIVDTTAKVTGKVLTAADQKKITDEANKELAA